MYRDFILNSEKKQNKKLLTKYSKDKAQKNEATTPGLSDAIK